MNTINLSKEQIKFLSKVNKEKEYIYKKHEINMVMYLCETKVLIQYTKTSSLSYCRLTEFGKAYLYTRKIEDRFRYTPIIISIVALVISACSIVLSPFFTAFFTSLYGLTMP